MADEPELLSLMLCVVVRNIYVLFKKVCTHNYGRM